MAIKDKLISGGWADNSRQADLLILSVSVCIVLGSIILIYFFFFRAQIVEVYLPEPIYNLL